MIRFVIRLYDYMVAHKLVCALSFVVVTLTLIVSLTQLNYKEDISDFLPVSGKEKEALSVYQDISGANRIFIIFEQKGDSASTSPELIIDAIKEMKILEVKELVDAMKEEFGVDPSAVAVAAAPAASAAAEEKTDATVVLKDAGSAKIQVIKAIRDITGLGLMEAKKLADEGGNIKENAPMEEANEIKAKLEEAGATVELA